MRDDTLYTTISAPDRKARLEQDAVRQIESRQRQHVSKRDMALTILALVMLLGCSGVSFWWWLAFASH